MSWGILERKADISSRELLAYFFNLDHLRNTTGGVQHGGLCELHRLNGVARHKIRCPGEHQCVKFLPIAAVLFLVSLAQLLTEVSLHDVCVS